MSLEFIYDVFAMKFLCKKIKIETECNLFFEPPFCLIAKTELLRLTQSNQDISIDLSIFFFLTSLVLDLSSRRLTHHHVFVSMSLALSSHWYLLGSMIFYLILGSSYFSILKSAKSFMFPWCLVTGP